MHRHRRFLCLFAATLWLGASPCLAQGVVASLTLIDADTNQPVAGLDPLVDGAVLDLAALPPSLNIRANTEPATVGSVRFGLDGNANFQTESVAPYALAGDSSGNYNAWQPAPGRRTVTATAFEGSGGSGASGPPLVVSFDVVESGQGMPPSAGLTLQPDRVPPGDDFTTVITLDAGTSSDLGGAALSVSWDAPGAEFVEGTTASSTVARIVIAGDIPVPVTLTVQDAADPNRFDTATAWIGLDVTGPAVLTGRPTAWYPIELRFAGPTADETDDAPNPFLDYRLQVRLDGPSGQSLDVPGFFDGDGKGNGNGDVWTARFSLDEVGTWSYTASFRSGADVAVDLDPAAGVAAAFDGATGSFQVAPRDAGAPGFLRWGRLEYANRHYLKFRQGGYYIKGGADSPENFFGYAGFDDVQDNGGLGIIHRYGPHEADWRAGDPLFVSASSGVDSRGIIGALNYLESAGVNSVYFLPMNLGGDAQDTVPFVGYQKNAFDKTHYDISRLHQWNQVLDHGQRHGIKWHFVLAETESGNENWLDDGLSTMTFGVERKLFFRELIARFSYLMAIKWNLSEENDYPVSMLRAFADYLQALDPAGHPICVHTKPNNFRDYDDILGESRFSTTSIQYGISQAAGHVENWRAQSATAGRPWVLDMDENNPANTGLTDSNADDLRRSVLYPVYFSGGNIEWYFGASPLPVGGDQNTEDFRTREPMWGFMRAARRLIESELPFWRMQPDDSLLTGESGNGQVFAAAGQAYAIYLPDGGSSTLDLGGTTGIFERRWFNPVSGNFAGAVAMLNGGGSVPLGSPPFSADAVAILQRVPPLPASTLQLSAELISWPAVSGATSYDVVSGDLGELRASGGDFAAASPRCEADDHPTPQWGGVPSPPPGEGRWILVRAVGLDGNASYDSTGSAQRAPRDLRLEASGGACP